MSFYDFCSGAGIGASGIEKYFSINLAVDSNKDAISSYRLNHQSTKTICRSVLDLDYLQGDFESIIALLATPPCQDFSRLNKNRSNDTERANLVQEFIRAVTEIKPTFGLFENVYSVPKVRKESVINQLEQLGYKVISKVINAHDYGSAQIRKRWLVTFSKTKHIFPEPVMDHQRKLAKDVLDYSVTQSEINPRAKTLTKIQSLESGKWVAIEDQDYKVYFVVDENKPLPAIVNPTKLRYIFPDRTRYLSLKELLRAFGLSDYKLVGTLSSKGQQIANGFPVELTEAFAKAFFKEFGDLS